MSDEDLAALARRAADGDVMAAMKLLAVLRRLHKQRPLAADEEVVPNKFVACSLCGARNPVAGTLMKRIRELRRPENSFSQASGVVCVVCYPPAITR